MSRHRRMPLTLIRFQSKVPPAHPELNVCLWQPLKQTPSITWFDLMILVFAEVISSGTLATAILAKPGLAEHGVQLTKKRNVGGREAVDRDGRRAHGQCLLQRRGGTHC